MRDLGATGARVWKRLDKSQLFHPVTDFYSESYQYARLIKCTHTVGKEQKLNILYICIYI